ncbi:hypothetical protein [Clostridium botulinum]|uniref:hypothetical protein n=1 Tax=Clostridium botulinum TaxID=1491 RepID=UPI003DA3D73F
MIKQVIKKAKVKINNGFDYLDNIAFNSQSNLGKAMVTINRENKYIYSDNTDDKFKECIRIINEFYLYELDDFCKKNKLNKISELICRKKELENDKNYYLNILIGIITGIVSTKILSVFTYIMKIDSSTLWGAVQYLLIAIVLIFGMLGTIIFIRYLIKFERYDKYNEWYYVNDFELKVITRIVDELQEKSLSCIRNKRRSTRLRKIKKTK